MFKIAVLSIQLILIVNTYLVFSQSPVSHSNATPTTGNKNLNDLDPQSLYNFGLYYLDQDELEKASKYFSMCIVRDSEIAEPYAMLAQVNVLQENYVNAIQFGQIALQKDSSLTEVHYNLYLSYQKEGREIDALNHLKKAAKSDPEFITRKGAELIIEYDDVTRALNFFTIVHEVAPTNILNSLNYAKALSLMRMNRKSLKVLEIAYQVIEPSSKYFDVLYKMYFNSLLRGGDLSTILILASDKAPASYDRQYFYQALAHYMSGNMREFESMANRYFEYASIDQPTSLSEWAEAQMN